MAITARQKVARLTKQNGSLRKTKQQLQSAYKAYSPSVMNSITTAGGGFLAGAVMSGKFVPSEVAGISTPLVIGGILASYGIFLAGDEKTGNDAMTKAAVNLGNGMISAWASQYAMDMFSQPVQQQTTSSIS